MKDFYKADEVQKILGVGKSKAYQIIHKLNDELADKGYLTTSGRVSKKYFEERTYIYEEVQDKA